MRVPACESSLTNYWFIRISKLDSKFLLKNRAQLDRRQR
ncbi:hypothetical protein CBM2629_B90090 [Cupriavidus taiwanensis]|nr:hypothetical protein CBM2629_B90090 [Cupriavidus taiwanensis]